MMNEEVKKITKDSLIKIFDKIFDTDLSKLSVQEFSKNINELPTTTPFLRNHQSFLIEDENYLRDRNKFLKSTNEKR